MRQTTRRARAELFVLFAVAVAVRALWPSAIWFARDQATHLESARAVLGGAWLTPGPVIGWSHFTLGPLFNWVVALGLLVRNNAVDAVVLVALLHGLAVVGWARLLLRLDPSAGRLAGWALALHPLSVASGAALWNPVLILPCTLLFVWGIERWVQSEAPAGFALACVGAALMLQGHVTTLLLLPLFILGWRRKAPIGAVGFVGLGVAAVLIAPMAVRGIAVLVHARSVAALLHHAGTSPSAAPYPLALLRAAALEGVLDRMTPHGPGALRACLLPAVAVWIALAWLGAVVVGRAAQGVPRGVLIGGLAVPVLVVPLLPLGALFYYLDMTIPLRCWLFAAGVGVLARRASRAAAAAVAFVALAVPLGQNLASRAAARRDGFVQLAMAATDLRVPWSPPAPAMALPTLATVRAVGRVLGDAGVTREEGARALRGPWKAFLSQGIGAWLPRVEAASGGSAAAAPAPDAQAFLVLQKMDSAPHPMTPPVLAGSFLVYPFADRATLAGEAPRWGLHLSRQDITGPLVVQLAVEVGTGAPRVLAPDGSPLSLSRADSPSGFAVWSAAVAPALTDLSIVRDETSRNLFWPAALEVYAFEP